MSSSPTVQKSDVRILLPSFKKHWHYIALAVGFSLAAAIFEGISIGMLIPFLQTLSENVSEPFRTGITWVDQHLLKVNGTTLERLYRACALILFATWLRSLFTYFQEIYVTMSRARTIEDLRVRIVDQFKDMSLRFYSKTRSGDLLNSVMNEITRTSESISVLFSVLTKSVLLFSYLALMIWISWELTLISLLFLGLLSGALTWLIKSVKVRGEKITETNARFTNAITEFIGGIRTVFAFNMEAYERKRLAKEAHASANSVIESTKRHAMIGPISKATVGTMLVVLVVMAVQYYVLPGKLDIAFILTFLFALFRLVPVVHELNNQRGNWASNRAGIANVTSLLRREDKPYLDNGTRLAPPLREAIEFQDVSFAYEEGSPVLHSVNACFEQGKITAIVGGSGAGKSTLVDLIPRFYDPYEGQVTWDGTDLREFDVASLRKRIAIVSQNTQLFNDSARNNIAYGRPSASFDEIYEAASRANALEFIQNMEDGFDTMLGDQGVRLSGGQRQRIAIARAILRDPEILILDEATSNLDTVSEKLVQESLEQLMQGRTVIAIAHRLSTIENADWVIVLEDGRIVEQGTYANLLENRGQLWKYHRLQFQAAE